MLQEEEIAIGERITAKVGCRRVRTLEELDQCEFATKGDSPCLAEGLPCLFGVIDDIGKGLRVRLISKAGHQFPVKLTKEVVRGIRVLRQLRPNLAPSFRPNPDDLPPIFYSSPRKARC